MSNHPNRKNRPPLQYRQGDIMLEEIVKLPSSLAVMPAEDGRLIVARGEATGHHHSFPHMRGATLFRDNGGEAETLYVASDAPTVAWEHQEHHTIDVPAGNYRVIRQREYTPERIRRVED